MSPSPASSLSAPPLPSRTHLSPSFLPSPSTNLPTAAPTPPQPQQQLFDAALVPLNSKHRRGWSGADDPDPRWLERREEGGREWGRIRGRQQDDELPDAAGYPDCNYVGNNILSCFPESNTTLVQNIWSKFIWNAQYPVWIGAGSVDIYLYHADSETIATSYAGIQNARGMIGILPDDDWWAVETTSEWANGGNKTFEYFFVIVSANASLTGGEVHQSTFTVVQTAMPASLSSSLSSLSSVSAASASSLASVESKSSASLSSLSSASSASVSASLAGLQPTNNSRSSSFPAWGIALLVIFGLAFLLLVLIGTYFLMRYVRRRSLEGAQRNDSNTSDQGSGEPMLSASDAVPPAAVAAAAGREREMRETGPGLQDPPAGISSSDAERMAAAFREALRSAPEGRTP